MADGKTWCLPKTEADSEALQRNIDYVCGLGLDCGPIQENGPCFLPNTVRAHAAYVMNAYFQATDGNDSDCDFQQTGDLTTVDPSESLNYKFALPFFNILNLKGFIHVRYVNINFNRRAN